MARARRRHQAVAGVLATLALAAAGLTGCGDDSTTTSRDGTRTLNGVTREPPLRVGGVSLPDRSPQGRGAAMAMKAKRHGLLLVYFGYTMCPDICPTTLADVRGAVQRLPAAQRRRIEFAMVTVDPRRDTAAVLNGYLSHFFRSWHSLRTTDAVALRRAERAFRAHHVLGKPDRQGSYDVSHTAQVYAVDGSGTVRVEWPFGTGPAPMAADLRAALAGQRGP
jgi:protein SCO1